MRESLRLIKASAWGECLLDGKHPELLSVAIKRLKEAGVEIIPLRDPRRVPLLAIEIRSLPETLVLLRRGKLRWVLSLEPPVVNPFGHSRTLSSLCSESFVLSPHFAHRKNSRFFWLGSQLVEGFRFRDEPIETRSVSVGVVNSNKMSFLKGEMYSKRIELIFSISQLGIPVTVAGNGWRVPMIQNLVGRFRQLLVDLRFPHLLHFSRSQLKMLDQVGSIGFVGPVISPARFLSNFRFSLVVENDQRYVSEKIFHAIEAGTVPLYLGPDLKTVGIPSSVAWPLSLEDTLGSISDILQSPVAQQGLLEAGKAWIEQACQTHSFESTWSAFFDGIAESLLKND